MLLIVLFCVVSVYCDTVTVVTKKGSVVGYKGNGYNPFYGVPYARVDEDNPFGVNQEYPNFKSPFNATDSSIICPQVFGSNDGKIQCLTLNIFVPQTANTNNLRPILVWFFGGGFSRGSANDYGGKYLVKHDILVVTVNYRLGAYGFLCLNVPEVPGNQGLKDQISALRWLKDNAYSFGGDATKITIAGESYGGGAVELHLYSKYERLFDKVIVQSGSIFAEGFYMKPDYELGIKLANNLGHIVNSTKDALRVLSKETPANIMNAAKSLGARLSVCKEIKFKDVNNFVTDDPFNIKAKRMKNIPIMIGYNSKEDFGSYANQPDEYYKSIANIFYSKLKANFNLNNDTFNALSAIVKAFYLGGKEIKPESMLELSDFTSDFRLNSAVERSIDKLVQQGAIVYKYLFSYTGSSPYKNITGVGSIHTEELSYIFAYDGVDKVETEETKTIRDRMTTLWSNFVKFGNPTPEVKDVLPIIWTTITNSSRPYMNIDMEMSLQDHVYHSRIAFWDLFWREYYRRSIVYNGFCT